ncbi:MAG: hypothetical protein NVS9B12_01940 [Vulcanimicrobiaceae bacterium]
MNGGTPLPDLKDVPNFGRLLPWLARGAHPNPAGYKWLVNSGVKTIVNLRAEDNTEELLAPLGFELVHIPVADNAAPSQEQAMQWLALASEEARRPLYIHCQSGHGRTSTFCILFRLAQGWKLSDSIAEEAQKYGFQPDHDVLQVAFLKGMRDLKEAGVLAFPAIPAN